MSVRNIHFSARNFRPYFNYWEKRLNALTEPFYLAQEAPGPGETDERLWSSLLLDQQQLAAIDAMVHGNPTGRFVVITTLLSVMIERYTDGTNVILESPLYAPFQAGPAHVDSVPLVLDVDKNRSIREHLRHCQDVIGQAYKYGNFPLDLLHGQQPKDMLSDVFISCPEIHQTEDHQAPLWIQITQEDDSLKVAFGAKRGYYHDPFPKCMIDHLDTLIEALENRETRLGDLDPRSAKERAALEGFNATERSLPEVESVLEIFASNVETAPNDIAMIQGDRQWTYRGLDQSANGLALILGETMNITSGDVVALMVDRHEPMVVSIMAILKLGAVYLPIDPSYPEARKQYLLEDAGAKLLLSTKTHLEGLSGDTPSLDLNQLQIRPEADAPPLPMGGDAPAYLIYTSGSTGLPKGVLVQHRGLLNMVLAQNRIFGINDRDRVVQFASFSFDASVSEIFTALCARAALVQITRSQIEAPDALLKWLREKRVTVATLPPAYAAALNVEELTFLRVLISAGEAVRADDAYACARYLSYFNAYGPTECSVCTTIQRVTPETNKPIPIGEPIDNMQVHILDRHMRAVPLGVTGELYVAGTGVALGYRGRPALTAERFIPNPAGNGTRLYRTGDQGYFRPDGTVVFMGRNDHQVKVNGYRIEVGEIEALLRSLEAVQDAVVVARDASLTAYVVSDETVGALRAHLQQQLPEYMVPRTIISLPAFPLTTHGKVDLSALQEMEGKSAAQGMYHPPQTDMEMSLAGIWQDVLGKKRVGRNDQFFVLGGDSMKAIRLVARVKDQFDATLEVKDLFLHQDVKSLAQFIDVSKASDEDVLYLEAKADVDGTADAILADTALKATLPVDFEGIYPISDIQSGMIFHYMLEADFPIYHCQLYVQFKDPHFQLAHYQEALHFLVERHPLLRTSFHLTHYPKPVQIIHHHRDLADREIHFEDLTSLDVVGQRARLLQLAQVDRSNAFSIEIPGQWRLGIYQVDENAYGLFWSAHHAILDGWSDATFLSELGTLVKQIRGGESPQWPKPKASYRDFLIDQAMRKRDSELQEFWKNQLAGYTWSPIPFARSDAHREFDNNIGYFSQPLPRRIGRELGMVAQVQETSVREVCLAAFMYLMYATTNTRDITLGLVCNARPEVTDGDRILGCFLNTVPFRMEVPTSITGVDLIQSVSQQSHALKAYDKLPLNEIARLIGETTSNRNLIYDVMFNFADFHVLAETQSLDMMEPVVSLDETATNTALIFAVSKDGDDFKVVTNYIDALFEVSEIRYLCHLYMRILENFVQRIQEPLSLIGLLDEQASRELLVTLNQTDGNFPREKTLPQLFREQAVRTPDKVALRCQGETWTYQELSEWVGRTAHHLSRTYDLKANDLIGLMVHRSPWLVVSILAVMEAGGAYVPMDPDFPLNRLLYMAEDAQLKAVMAYKSDRFDLGCPLIEMDELSSLVANEPTHAPETRANAHSTAYVIYTSGSTGKPKGVEVAHRSVVNFLTSMTKEPGMDGSDILLAITTPTFDISVLELMLPLVNGARLVLVPKEQTQDPQTLSDLIASEQATIVQATPSTWRILVHHGWRGEQHLKILCGGELLEPTLGASLLERCDSLWNMYGPTETTIWSTARLVATVDDLYDVGRPILNTRLYIVDKQGQLLPRGVPGELCIAGDGLAKGYRNRPQLTQEKFTTLSFPRERVFRTGDLAQWLPSGNLRFLGRLDDQVKVHGHRIELGEIDTCLLSHEAIGEAVTALKQDHSGHDCLCAYYIVDKPVNPAELRTFLGEHLPAYMVPHYFTEVTSFPMTSSGKTNRAALPQPQAAQKPGETHDLPQGETEQRLHDIWSDLLGTTSLPVGQSFFVLGGHSLSAVQMLLRVRETFGVELALKTIFAHPSIRSLSAALDKLKTSANIESTVIDGAMIRLNEAKPDSEKLFMVPPVLGSPAVFLGLAAQLEGQYQCYGLQCRGLHGNQPFDSSIENMASRFTTAIVDEVEDRTEIHLLGYSMGASVAFEVAARLEARNYRTLLYLFDGSVGGRGANVYGCYDQEVEEQINRWSAQLGHPVRLEKMLRHNLTLFDGHRIRTKISGKIVGFEAEHSKEERAAHPNPGMMRWANQTSGPFFHTAIDGGHHDILDDPYLPDLVAKITHFRNA